MPGPIEEALLPGSTLAASVRGGIRAVKDTDRFAIDASIRRDFRDSLDLDTALAAEYPNAPRWDYLLGHRSSGIVALEIHPATQKHL